MVDILVDNHICRSVHKKNSDDNCASKSTGKEAIG